MKIFNSAFYNCSDVFKENSSAPSGYYTIRAPNGSIFSVYCDIEAYINGLTLSNCSKIWKQSSLLESGFYTIQLLNGNYFSVYCDMEGSNCDGKGGWMSVATST